MEIKTKDGKVILGILFNGRPVEPSPTERLRTWRALYQDIAGQLFNVLAHGGGPLDVKLGSYPTREEVERALYEFKYGVTVDRAKAEREARIRRGGVLPGRFG